MHTSSSRQTVDVLLATFNGERYLEEQLHSLDQQEDVNVRVWANDDGSDDGTLAILLKWQKLGLINNITKTQRIGSTRAFLKLLSEHSDSEYVAFCDQDDIWDPIKLITQVGNLTEETPMVVASQRLYINSTGAIIGKSRMLRTSPCFENAMVENIAPGNTILMNSQAIKLTNSFPNPAIAHYDSWIYLLITAFGRVDFLHQPLTRYRIHSSNAVGLRKFSVSRIAESVSRFVDQAVYFHTISGPIEQFLPREKAELFIMARSETDIVKRLRIVKKIGLMRQSRIEGVIFKFFLLLDEKLVQWFLRNPNS